MNKDQWRGSVFEAQRASEAPSGQESGSLGLGEKGGFVQVLYLPWRQGEGLTRQRRQGRAWQGNSICEGREVGKLCQPAPNLCSDGEPGSLQ